MSGIAWPCGPCRSVLDQFFRQRLEPGVDLDWAGAWTAPFLVLLRQAGVRTVLELTAAK
ncbi:MAG TPA: hypothetical protein VN969_47470 [Streptosporangiaceae bacterium]|nr:hypothetical protein [Streptosporangiaceae bacterium]